MLVRASFYWEGQKGLEEHDTENDTVLAVEYIVLHGSQHKFSGTTEFSSQQADLCPRIWVSPNTLQV